jgi:adenylate cyclase
MPELVPALGVDTSKLHSKVVAIDGKTLIQYGFPLKRAFYAELFDGLRKAEVGPVAVDVIFGATEDYSGSLKLAESLSRFTDASGKANVTLSAISSSNWIPDRDSWGDLISRSTLPASMPIQNAIALDGPWPPVSDAAHRIALTDSQTDEDGNLRWYELVHPGPEGFLPSLALSQYLSASSQAAEVEVEKEGRITGIRLKREGSPSGHIELWDDPEGRGRIPLLPIAKSGLLPDVSLSEVLSGGVSVRENLKNQPIFIGTTLDGARPIQPTPLDPLQAAVHNHQAAFESLWTGRILHRGWMARVLEVLLAFGAVFLYSGIIHLSVLRQTFAERIYFALSLTLKIIFFKFGIWAHITPAILAIGSLRTASVMDEYDRAEKQRRFLKEAFSNYLSPHLVEELVSNPDKASLGGEEKMLTLFFCDLRGFTSLSEGLPPTQVMKMMNQYFELVSAEILRFEGTIDKYIGDAVMAFWGAPVAVVGAEAKAVQCAGAISEKLRGLAEEWERELNRKVEVNIGIGLHAGVAIVGNVGGKSRFNYTAMGDTVNVASRIEGLTKAYGVSLLLSGELHSRLGDPKGWLKLDYVRVAGRQRALELFAPAPSDVGVSELYGLAFSAYEKGDFRHAALLVQDLDYAPAKLLARRCAELDAKRPVTWEGIHSFEK